MDSQINAEKIDQMIEFCKINKIDVAILSETNGKWITRTTDIMNSKVKELRRETSCYYADSKPNEIIDSDWLEGGTMNVITGRISSLIQPQQVKIDKVGRWMDQKFSNEKKTITIIKLHRIPQGTNQGIQTLMHGHNQMRGKLLSVTKDRK